MNQMMFALRGEGSQTLEIDVYDVIGESYWRESVSAKSVRAKLKENKNASTIKLRVNSRGGDVIDGFAIYNLLNEHPARVEVDVDALAASMASVIIMAADEIRMAENAMVMIHNPWSVGMGDAEELRATADVLDKMRDQIANAYVVRTGLGRDEVLAMMDAETWLSAKEAKDKGFADVVKPSKKGAAKKKALASLDLSEFHAVPPGFMAAVAQAKSAGPQNIGESAEETEDMNGQENRNERLSLLDRIEKAVGKSGDEAHGVVLAALSAQSALASVQADLDKAQARIAELEQGQEAAALEQAIAQAKQESKCTPAIESSVRDAFAAKQVTLKGAQAWLSALPTISALAAAKEQKPKLEAAPGSAAPAVALKHNGKSYAEMKPSERAALKKENPELFAAMRSASN